MLLHLPIVILATLSPIHVSDTVPTFDIVRECRYEGGSAANVEQCSQDETAALGQLKTKWVQFVGADKRSCVETTQIGGFASYVELLTCLEMARDVKSAESKIERLKNLAKVGFQLSPQLRGSVGDLHGQPCASVMSSAQQNNVLLSRSRVRRCNSA